MCTTINVLEQKKKYIVIFHPKIKIFTAVKYCCILHGRVCVMLFEQQEQIFHSCIPPFANRDVCIVLRDIVKNYIGAEA